MQYAEKENKYIGKLARAVNMSKAVDVLRGSIKVGDWVTVMEYTGSTTGERRTISGRVIYKNEHYFTIQTKHYRESFSLIDVALGQIEII